MNHTTQHSTPDTSGNYADCNYDDYPDPDPDPVRCTWCNSVVVDTEHDECVRCQRLLSEFESADVGSQEWANAICCLLDVNQISSSGEGWYEGADGLAGDLLLPDFPGFEGTGEACFAVRDPSEECAMWGFSDGGGGCGAHWFHRAELVRYACEHWEHFGDATLPYADGTVPEPPDDEPIVAVLKEMLGP